MKIVIIGPFPNPITGNSLANQVVFENLPRYYPEVYIEKIDTSFSSFKEDLGGISIVKVWYYMKQYISITKILNCDKLYYTSGQTFFGVLKYLPYLLFAKLLKKEIIIHIHGNFLRKKFASLKGFKSFLIKKTIQLCDKGIVLSSSLRGNLTPFLSDNQIFELENFVEDFLFDGKITKHFDKLRIIYFSNLMTEKGIFDFLSSLKTLVEMNVEFEARIAGSIDISIEQKLKSILNDFVDRVNYLGIVHGLDKKSLLEWGNVFILPTRLDEGQPISILEAMALGAIVITTKQGGIPDVFKEKINGFYVEINSPKSIVSQLRMISKDFTKYIQISDRNIKEAREKYSVENFINKLHQILNA